MKLKINILLKLIHYNSIKISLYNHIMKYNLYDIFRLSPIILIPLVTYYNLTLSSIWLYQSTTLYYLFTNHYKNRINKNKIKIIFIPINLLTYYMIYQSLNKFLLTSLIINAFNLHYCLYL
jgi:hypothetical protein